MDVAQNTRPPKHNPMDFPQNPIIFIVAGIIALLLRNITYDSHATVLINCGFVTLVIGVLIEFGSKRKAMSDEWSSWRSSSQQQLRKVKDLKSSSKASLNLYLIGIIPVVIGCLVKVLILT